MDTNRLISSLCYFSVFFAGFIFPIAVYFIVPEREVKNHAKKAFLSHLIPLLTIPLFIIMFFSFSQTGHLEFGFIGVALLFGLVNIIVVIWNVVKGIKVLI
ncbi:DUF4870 domain-containing protein [Bacillus sp. PS06]|uniref:DUF4870 domain-containing protein n=1 Tax=Bacillus sp. PS06 TaxID=2764176 RepID=UPI0017816888|nr:DUF4870 domain-containing protein [Bacillus sp. PS06]MBD8071475.1 DUF4870 domain-containing protein [Bacillus sp. PS06]